MPDRAPPRATLRATLIPITVEVHPAVIAIAHMLFSDHALEVAAVALEAGDFPTPAFARVFAILRGCEPGDLPGEFIAQVQGEPADVRGAFHEAAALPLEALDDYPIESLVAGIRDSRPRRRRSSRQVRADLEMEAAR